MLDELQDELRHAVILDAEHLHIDESERVVSSEEGADAEDELAGEVPQLREEAVEEEGEGEAAHGDGHAHWVDHGVDDLTHTGLSLHANPGKVGHIIAGNFVAEVVSDEKVFNAIFLIGVLRLVPPVDAHWQRPVGDQLKPLSAVLAELHVIERDHDLVLAAVRLSVVHRELAPLLVPPGQMIQLRVVELAHSSALRQSRGLLHVDLAQQTTLADVFLVVVVALQLAAHWAQCQAEGEEEEAELHAGESSHLLTLWLTDRVRVTCLSVWPVTTGSSGEVSQIRGGGGGAEERRGVRTGLGLS